MSKRMLVVQQMLSATKSEMEETQERGRELCSEYGYESCTVPVYKDLFNMDNRFRCELAGDMLGALSECDAAVFMDTWHICPICRLIHEACKQFGVPTFYDGKWVPWDELEE